MTTPPSWSSFRDALPAPTTVIWIFVVLGGAWTLVASPHRTGDGLGLRRFVTPAVSNEVWISQTFEAGAAALSAVDLHPVAVGPVAGRLRLELWDVASGRGERQAEIEATEFVRAGVYRFAFKPVEQSAGRTYRLDIRSAGDTADSGVGLRATKGERYQAGALFIKGRQRWADAAFSTYPQAPSLFSRLLHSPDRRGAGITALVGLLTGWIAVGVVLRHIVTERPSSPGLRRPRTIAAHE